MYENTVWLYSVEETNNNLSRTVIFNNTPALFLPVV